MDLLSLILDKNEICIVSADINKHFFDDEYYQLIEQPIRQKCYPFRHSRTCIDLSGSLGINSQFMLKYLNKADTLNYDTSDRTVSNHYKKILVYMHPIKIKLTIIA